MQEKAWQFKKLEIFLTEWSCSYIIFALRDRLQTALFWLRTLGPSVVLIIYLFLVILGDIYIFQEVTLQNIFEIAWNEMFYALNVTE